jgi:hypothetical protein
MAIAINNLNILLLQLLRCDAPERISLVGGRFPPQHSIILFFCVFVNSKVQVVALDKEKTTHTEWF